MRGWPLPALLVLGLLGLSGVQLARDVGERPGFATRRGLPVTLASRPEAPAEGDVATCWPSERALAAELPELSALTLRFGQRPPCPEPLPEAIELERWSGGRFVWFPGRRLAYERW